MIVGDKDKREVSALNNELFTRAGEILEQGVDDNRWHIGWQGIGNFIDWLEANYTIEKKPSTDKE